MSNNGFLTHMDYEDWIQLVLTQYHPFDPVGAQRNGLVNQLKRASINYAGHAPEDVITLIFDEEIDFSFARGRGGALSTVVGMERARGLWMLAMQMTGTYAQAIGIANFFADIISYSFLSPFTETFSEGNTSISKILRAGHFRRINLYLRNSAINLNNHPERREEINARFNYLELVNNLPWAALNTVGTLETPLWDLWRFILNRK